jgi:hypothetical protein
MWIANPYGSKKRRGHRRKRFGRNPSDVVGSVAGEAKRAFSPKSFTGNIVTGLQVAGGYAGVSAFGSVLSRLGAGGLLARVPEGIARTLVGYGLKGFTVGLVDVAARLAGLGGDLRTNIKSGARANFGVTVMRDLAGVIPGGARVQAFLSGMGNYFQSDGWPAMGDYLNVQMQPTLPPPAYAPTDGIYGQNSDMYGGTAQGSIP